MRYYPEDDPDFREEDASQEESAFQKQAWFVIGIACLLCAGLILYSLFFTGPKVWEDTGLSEVSSLASGVSAVSQTSDTASWNSSGHISPWKGKALRRRPLLPQSLRKSWT